jgi:hypothetical protein
MSMTHDLPQNVKNGMSLVDIRGDGSEEIWKPVPVAQLG